MYVFHKYNTQIHIPGKREKYHIFELHVLHQYLTIRVKVHIILFSIHRKIESNSIWIIGRDKLIPEIKVAPVDGVEDEEQDGRKDKEKPSVESQSYYGKNHHYMWSEPIVTL